MRVFNNILLLFSWSKLSRLHTHHLKIGGGNQ